MPLVLILIGNMFSGVRNRFIRIGNRGFGFLGLGTDSFIFGIVMYMLRPGLCIWEQVSIFWDQVSIFGKHFLYFGNIFLRFRNRFPKFGKSFYTLETSYFHFRNLFLHFGNISLQFGKSFYFLELVAEVFKTAWTLSWRNLYLKILSLYWNQFYVNFDIALLNFPSSVRLVRLLLVLDILLDKGKRLNVKPVRSSDISIHYTMALL